MGHPRALPDKHDPCRCRQGHRTALSSRVGFKTSSSGQERQIMNVTYERCDEGYVPSSPSPRRRSSASGRGIRRDSLEGRSSLRQRPSRRPTGTPAPPSLALVLADITQRLVLIY
ncbi:uncharacterized protein LOC119571848 [Penaeus monodon]|uniref:uncharacterized protein LOC119571848 n=1 Tax=Penaeus monodon TaxID=6687 RepID=UPI0018A7CD08|nr:uncharacterized protein LOC119571848 [Penaeus monodon]